MQQSVGRPVSQSDTAHSTEVDFMKRLIVILFFGVKPSAKKVLFFESKILRAQFPCQILLHHYWHFYYSLAREHCSIDVLSCAFINQRRRIELNNDKQTGLNWNSAHSQWRCLKCRWSKLQINDNSENNNFQLKNCIISTDLTFEVEVNKVITAI